MMAYETHLNGMNLTFNADQSVQYVMVGISGTEPTTSGFLSCQVRVTNNDLDGSGIDTLDDITPKIAFKIGVKIAEENYFSEAAMNAKKASTANASASISATTSANN